jgi:hypothetical protein
MTDEQVNHAVNMYSTEKLQEILKGDLTPSQRHTVETEIKNRTNSTAESILAGWSKL